ncbi:NAD(P)/FAD-dependent oxidoreductase [Burkholderia multivorans]|uniref:NAD(P)/FAD-dependent oxidoreductase n=1 Tax=Burkholderia multivorans TaxID=87883 RepID=UPI0021BF60DB|nr:FAD-dependent oxidoreductase [Burkholderia multivorans]
MQNPLVVVGASLAGLHAVRGARSSGYEGPITLVGAEYHLPYDRPPLSKQHLAEELSPPDNLVDRTELEDKLGVKLLLGRRATGLDIDHGVLHLSDGEVPYGRLVIATGSDAKRILGTEDIGAVIGLRTYDDAQRIKQRLFSGAKVVVIGAGLIGSEVASSAIGRGAHVTLVEAGTAPLARVVGNEIGNLISSTQIAAGIDLRLSTFVEGIEKKGDGAIVALSDGSRLEADLVVVGIGSTPATDWLANSGLLLECDQSISCDSHLRAAPGIYAAGDVATWWNEHDGARVRMENWTNAMAQGRHAGRNAVAESSQATPYQAVSYVWTDLHGMRIQMAGTINDASVEVVVPGSTVSGLIAVYRRGNTAVGIVSADQSPAMARGRRLLSSPNNLDAVVDALHKASVVRAVV